MCSSADGRRRQTDPDIHLNIIEFQEVPELLPFHSRDVIHPEDISDKGTLTFLQIRNTAVACAKSH